MPNITYWQDEIKTAQAHILQAKRAIALLENLPEPTHEEKKIAATLHKIQGRHTCHSSGHCWFTFTHDWYDLLHQEYLAKARTLLRETGNYKAALTVACAM